MCIRAADVSDSAAIAKVHVDSWRTTYAGIMPDEHLSSLSYEQREREWRNGLSTPGEATFTLVAQDAAGDVIGFASGGPERGGDPAFQGEIFAIYLLRAYQGMGLGRRLTRAVAERLMSEGFGSLLVWVLAENPSRRFYEALGGECLEEKVITIGGANLVEVAYGWRDLRVLTNTPEHTR